ncbi:bifunctional oligoribonuclease/PAP phosphatase NrnA [uncultured Ilyobacter sp.]|uniref:DHH family phosphoesterase n=1 Tax=uncultured Ilyobacter sp. TaxID=544433 RepID=UPI0029C777D9|nr:bifunctional oligoribonuclease/PAP phosphatase NrnA [uncultured Ilyobacter sp.]
MNSYTEIIDKIKDSERILLTSHVNPDGDALGSGLALFLALNEYNREQSRLDKNYMDKVVRFVLEDNVPGNLKFLKGTEMIENIKNVESKYKFDLVICLDSANKERIGRVETLIGEKSFVINIDHHTSNSRYGDINCIENISSTSEIMYNFIKELGIEIDKSIGEAIYTGVVNDTGNFAHSNVTRDTFLLASDLLERGVDNSKIVREFYNSKSMSTLRLMGKALEDMVYVPEKKFVYLFISLDTLKKLEAKREESEGLVELINSYEGSEVSMFLREEENGKIKGSLRSKHDKDVNAIAKSFDGGGHIKAAGFTSDLPVEEIIKKVTAML